MIALHSIMLLCLITFLTTLLIISPGKLKSFVDQRGQPLNGSISEKIFIKIGGVEQGMFIRGRYDLTVNNELSKEYLKKIEAPIKGFYTFEKSAHSPMFEEPKRLLKILTEDVLKMTTILADK